MRLCSAWRGWDWSRMATKHTTPAYTHTHAGMACPRSSRPPSPAAPTRASGTMQVSAIYTHNMYDKRKRWMDIAMGAARAVCSVCLCCTVFASQHRLCCAPMPACIAGLSAPRLPPRAQCPQCALSRALWRTHCSRRACCCSGPTRRPARPPAPSPTPLTPPRPPSTTPHTHTRVCCAVRARRRVPAAPPAAQPAGPVLARAAGAAAAGAAAQRRAHDRQPVPHGGEHAERGRAVMAASAGARGLLLGLGPRRGAAAAGAVRLLCRLWGRVVQAVGALWEALRAPAVGARSWLSPFITRRH